MNENFEEQQYFRQRWLWIMVGIGLSIGLVLELWTLAVGLRLAHSSGHSTTFLAVTTSIYMLLTCIFPLWLWMMHLETRVNDGEIWLRFRPFANRKIPIDEVRSAEARTYNAIREYGGWGIKYKRRGGGWSYSVCGDRGVQLELTNGKRILIGSQRAEELERAIAERLARGRGIARPRTTQRVGV